MLSEFLQQQNGTLFYVFALKHFLAFFCLHWCMSSANIDGEQRIVNVLDADTYLLGHVGAMLQKVQ